jgi:hypothetical protein
MPRKNLNSLSSDDKTEFFNLLIEYIQSDHDPINGHGNDADHHHGDHFLGWHRYFIAELEASLALKGKDKFVPIPFWNPAFPIPDEFSYPDAGRLSENINRPLPARFTVFGDGNKSLADYSSYAELNTDIERYHDGLHGLIGGLMANTSTTAGDPIFWSLHAMFDLVWEQWRAIK